MLAAAPIAAYLLLLSATSSEAQTGGGTTGGATEAPFCAPSERRVDSFSGNGSQLTPEFRITANQWRYVYEASPSPPDSSGNLEIQPLDDGGDPINIGSEFTAILGEEENQRSLNIEGPDSFSLNTVTRAAPPSTTPLRFASLEIRPGTRPRQTTIKATIAARVNKGRQGKIDYKRS